MKQPTAEPEEVWRIIRLIDSDPRVRDAIRQAILTRELLELPQRLAAFVEAADRRFQSVEDDLGILKSDMTIIKSDVAALKGDSYERQLRERAPAVLSRVAAGIRGLHVIPTADLADLLDEAMQAGTIDDRDREDALQADAVVRGISRDSGQSVHLTVEVAATLSQKEVARAIRRSRLVSRALGTAGVPVAVTGRVPQYLSTDGVEVVVVAGDEEQGAA